MRKSIVILVTLVAIVSVMLVGCAPKEVTPPPVEEIFLPCEVRLYNVHVCPVEESSA